ncbi:MAG: hypothetical protein IJ498_08730 [Akkermansia sp.]|nr:hypothetical protein [Akkermansia sp.]
MFDTAGSRLNFPVVAGVEETFRVSFSVGGKGMSVLGATFQAACYVAHGDERGELVAVLPVEHESAENKVRLTVPELEHGHYWWELRATDAVGKECRLLYGTLAALTSAEVARLAAEAEESSLRELMVEIGGGYAAPLVLRWQACSVAASLAADAARAAERAEAAADRAEDAEETVLGRLSAAQKFMESFNAALFEAIRVIDNYLWVGGVNTGHYLRGNDGITPHIGTDGYWYVGLKKLSDRPAFGKDGITPHITADGFWAFGDWKSSVRAEGRDGLDGTAVRRVLVERYEDIPQSGETCNGGFLYYVPAGVERAQRQVCSVAAGVSVSNYNLTGPMVFSDGRTWTRRGGRLLRMGLMAGSNTMNGEPSAEALYAHLYYEQAGAWVYAGHSVEAVAQVVNEVSWWDFDELEVVPKGCRVKVVLSQVESVPTEDQMETIRIQVAAVAATEGSKVGTADFCAWAYWGFETQELTAYDVYAWCESAGDGGWRRVDLNYDIATARTHGLTMLGTDSEVVGGAPVGVNAAGQMAVPIADPALPGAVLPSSASSTSGGGLTHVGADKKLYVGMADPSTPGVGKTSFTQVVENTGSVGLTADGKFAVPRAGAFQWGATRIGTSVPQSMGLPWIIPVGAAEDGVINEDGHDITGQLMNNVLVGGALRTALKETWLTWGPNGINVNLLPDNSNAVGLMTSRSFRQSAEKGLELVAATNSLLGGVTVCETVGSGSGLVPTVSAMVNYLRENYYTKSQVYSREETYSKAQVDDIDKQNRQDAAETYKTKAAAKTDHDVLSGRIDGCVKKTESWNGEVYLTLSEYNALKVHDPKIAYNILED